MILCLFADGVPLADITERLGISYTIDPLYTVIVKLTAAECGDGGNGVRTAGMDIDLSGCPESCGSFNVQINEPCKSFSFIGSPRLIDGNFSVRNMWVDVKDMTGGPDKITGSFS